MGGEPVSACYVGVDPASGTSGLAALDEEGTLQTLELRVTGDLADRLVQIRTDARRWLADIEDDGTWCCVIEKPVTQFGGASLFAAFGVLVEASRSTLACPIHRLTPAEIDPAAGVVKRPGDKRKDATWRRARELGYSGPSQDVADAVVAAAAARELTRREFEEAAA